MEIERKFTISRLPEDLDKYEVKHIEQGYLCTKPIVRIRKSNEDCYLTYKSKLNKDSNEQDNNVEYNKDSNEQDNNVEYNNDKSLDNKPDKEIALKNEEIEMPLSLRAYLHLKEKVDHNIIMKKRYIIPFEDLKIELDVFEGKLKGLYFAEVEFPCEEAAKNFKMPDWFAEDVSFDKRYRNNNLSKLNSFEEF